MKYIYTIFFFMFGSIVFAADPPKVTTQQFENWTYQCVESEKEKNCEVNQNIRIQNSNINFSIVYTKFLNEDKDSKKFSFPTNCPSCGGKTVKDYNEITKKKRCN